VASNDTHNNHQSVIDDCQIIAQQLQQLGVKPEFHWVPGHANVPGNDLADEHAKRAAQEAIQCPTGLCSLNTIKSHLRSKQNKLWQKAWDKDSSVMRVTRPLINQSDLPIKITRSSEIKLNRLRLGHTHLRAETHRKFGPKYAETPECPCGHDIQTVDHVIFHCPTYHNNRDQMIETIETTYLKHQTPPQERTLNLQTLLWPSYSNSLTTKTITAAFANFLDSINLYC
jgi:hypothetical protein